jgi:hypothetical protein
MQRRPTTTTDLWSLNKMGSSNDGFWAERQLAAATTPSACPLGPRRGEGVLDRQPWRAFRPERPRADVSLFTGHADVRTSGAETGIIGREVPHV